MIRRTYPIGRVRARGTLPLPIGTLWTRIVGAGLTAGVVLTQAHPARAETDGAARFDIRRLFVDGAALLQEASASFLPLAASSKDSSRGGSEKGSDENPERTGRGLWQAIGRNLRFSLVARDWRSAQALGGSLAVTDELPRSASCRMAVGRLRWSEGVVTPFAQLGIGQWRTDPSLFPGRSSREELAAQAAAGVEFHPTAHAAAALEVDYTQFYRGRHFDPAVPAHHVVGMVAAAKFSF